MADLLTLAQYNMVGSGLSQRTGRTPTMVLSTRLARTDALRCDPSPLLASPHNSPFKGTVCVTFRGMYY